ncbi:hypothetical protein SAMN05518849_12350 [Sphingobium sp. AP50]|nr:hypothetical protein SAMN05518849_12350 [Sphingobium sp. AP50]
MINPVGTGFSRELYPGGGQTFWSVQGHVESVERLIRTWLADYGRSGSLIYIAGKSYGGYLAGFLASTLSDLDVRGVFLLSPGIALSDYVTALHKRSGLPPADQDRVAQHVSKIIGLPISFIADANLRVNSQTFLEKLVPGTIVGRLDSRAAGNVPTVKDPARDAAQDDPSLGLEGGNVRISKPVADHFREMGAKAPGDYIVLTLDLNFRWDWRPHATSWDANLALDAAPAYACFTAALLKAHIVIAAAHNDFPVTPTLAPYSFAHSCVPLDRVDFSYYDAGHTISDDPAARKLLVCDIRSFIGGQ